MFNSSLFNIMTSNKFIFLQHGLHERMRPWISRKSTEVIGVEFPEFVDYVLRTTKEHVSAPRMVELLLSLLDDDTERFVLLMWRKLIFEIKRVETELEGTRPCQVCSSLSKKLHLVNARESMWIVL